jgi:ligand-binding sensor domain-containing protein
MRSSLRSSNISRDRALRRRRLLSIALIGVVVVYMAAQSQALDPHRAVAQYMSDRWGIDRGFPGGAVSAIAQSPDGYLWIGTDRGLVRFDGLNFRSFAQAGSTSSPIGPVRSLLADSDGNLWILLENTRILRYRDGKFDLGHDEAEFGVTAP